jgi:hypothetical protein
MHFNSDSQQYNVLQHFRVYFLTHSNLNIIEHIQINDLKANLDDKDGPFGIDLLLPQVGGSARKTNYDCTWTRAWGFWQPPSGGCVATS